MPASLQSTVRSCARRLLAQKRLQTQCSQYIAARRWNSGTSSSSKEPERKWSTPLAKQLSEAITATGPVPLASFMRMCLTSDMGGYYTQARTEGDVFGQKGDFITSPEISQVFGELIGIWFVAEWMAQGRPKAIELIEIGPGRGTLMDDMLRAIRNFKPMVNAIEAVYMVEASPALVKKQKNLLCGEDAELNEHGIGHTCTSKHGIPIVWTENIRFVPSTPEKTPFIVAHEFFDALPIHAFESVAASPDEPAAQPISIQTPTGVHQLAPEAVAKKSSAAKTPQWRELVVSPAPPGATHEDMKTPMSERELYPPLEFELTRAKASTPHSLYLPEMSERYKALKNTPGSLIEISPESHVYMAQIAERIGGSAQQSKEKPKGAALILDYGTHETIPINSLRGIKNHRRVSPLSEPGLVDLSADVDFIGLAQAALKTSEGVEVYGPIEQGGFLLQMGIKERAEQLARGKPQEKAKSIEGAWQRLIDRGPSGMGKVYKALAVVPESGGRRRPVGFGGDIQG